MTRTMLTLLAGMFAIGCSAHAMAAGDNHVLSISWYKDGKAILATKTILKDSFGSVTPYSTREGESVGYRVCKRVGDTQTLSALQQFVGRSLTVLPRAERDGMFVVSVSAEDTTYKGRHTEGNAECQSQVIDTSGLMAKDITVDLHNGQTVDVPLRDEHYSLRLTLSTE